MHYETYHQLAQGRQADLLREAEQHRLGVLARGTAEHRGRLASLIARIRRLRPQRRPVPAV